MNKDAVIKQLEQQLRAVKAERQTAQHDPALLAARTALKNYQAARLAASHADLLAAPETHDAARFFLDELYSSKNLGQRDLDLERMVPAMQHILPLQPLQAIASAVMLDALSERLDTAMARQLGVAFTDTHYAQAYRTVTHRAEREQQLALIATLGASLCELVRIPLLSLTLNLMRTPAQLAGLGQLQHFLEGGFGSFRKMKRPRPFVATIVAREQAILEAMYRTN